MNLYQVRTKISNGNTIFDIPLRVTFYARVSTDKDEQLHSLDNQITYFKDYIKQNKNWDYIDGYIDEGISGTSVLKREQFLTMINDSKNDKFDLILTKEISRFSRNTLDSIKYTTELLNNGVAVYFLSDNINTIYPDSELRLTIMSSIAQEEVRKLSERVRFGLKKAIKDGKVLGNSLIYGYKKNNGRLIIDYTEKEIITKIFELYVFENIGLQRLSSNLYSLGYTSHLNKPLSPTVIKRIIMNPKYKGYYCGNKTTIIDYKSKKKINLKESEWYLYQSLNNIPSIISEELWDKANEKLRLRSTSFKDKINDKTIFHNRYLYSGKIYCCHHQTYHRSASGTRSNNPTWECAYYRKYGNKGCNNIKLSEYKLDYLIKPLLLNKIDHNYLITNLIDLYSKYDENNLSLPKRENDLKIITSKQERLLELFLEGSITHEEYIIKKKSLENSYQMIENKIINYQEKEDYQNHITLIANNLNKIIISQRFYEKVFSLLVKGITVNYQNLSLNYYNEEIENISYF